jgi:hypothetical protein
LYPAVLSVQQSTGKLKRDAPPSVEEASRLTVGVFVHHCGAHQSGKRFHGIGLLERQTRYIAAGGLYI